MRSELREEFFALFLAVPSFFGTQSSQPRPASVEDCSGRQAQSHEIVAVLPGEDEIVLAAIETAAEERTAFVDRAARSTEIDALAIFFRGQQEQWAARCLICDCLVSVRRDIISQVRLEKKALVAFAALGAFTATDLGLLVLGQALL